MGDMPFFKLFPSDWLGSSKVRRLSPAARGVLIDVLCLAWQSSPRGTLQDGGEAWTLEVLASMLSGSTQANVAMLKEAIKAGCIVSVDGILQIPELVKQAETSAARAQSGAAGGYAKQKSGKPPSKSLANDLANHQANGWQSSSKYPSTSSRALARIQNPESRSQNPEEQTQEKTAAAANLESGSVRDGVRYEPDPEDQAEPKTAADAAVRFYVDEATAQDDEITEELRARTQARFEAIKKRPDWLPAGKPWLDDEAAMRIARNVYIGKAQVEAAIKATRESRNTLDNPAGYFIKKLEGSRP